MIHGPRLWQMQGLEGEAVVYHRETRQNAADAVRSARPEGKECRRLDLEVFHDRQVDILYE